MTTTLDRHAIDDFPVGTHIVRRADRFLVSVPGGPSSVVWSFGGPFSDLPAGSTIDVVEQTKPAEGRCVMLSLPTNIDRGEIGFLTPTIGEAMQSAKPWIDDLALPQPGTAES